MKANYLNQAFNPAQARAIEKYVEAALASKVRPEPAVMETAAKNVKPKVSAKEMPAETVTE